jgi:hypothetical protein
VACGGQLQVLHFLLVSLLENVGDVSGSSCAFHGNMVRLKGAGVFTVATCVPAVGWMMMTHFVCRHLKEIACFKTLQLQV